MAESKKTKNHAGKGSKQRPAKISVEEYAKRYDKAFGIKKTMKPKGKRK